MMVTIDYCLRRVFVQRQKTQRGIFGVPARINMEGNKGIFTFLDTGLKQRETQVVSGNRSLGTQTVSGNFSGPRGVQCFGVYCPEFGDQR